MRADILDRIVESRRKRIATEGPEQGLDLPAERPADFPLRPFPGPVICEIKRRSPSRGDLAAALDPVQQASRYYQGGAQAVSVLTEQDHFRGSLADLRNVKAAFPDLAVLRKDFLLAPEDVAVAWRAGADAILLIAAILSSRELSELLAAAEGYGLAALVEIHDHHDLDVIRPVRPALVGINSRNLRTFQVDTLAPLALGRAIDWPCRMVFESGVFWPEDVAAARDGGFTSVLVGEAVVKDPERVQLLSSAMERPQTSEPPQTVAAPATADALPFWSALASRRQGDRRPLVKICGITNREDAQRAVELGADLLGLVYAASPRTAGANLARELREAGIEVPLVAVVVEPETTVALEAAQPDENVVLLRSAQGDLAAGYLSALQLHGAARPEAALQFGWPYYRAVRPGDPADARVMIMNSRSPRTLVDARHPTLAGGSGRQVHPETVEAVIAANRERGRGALWLAGGLAPENVGAVVAAYRPELVDASSRLEAQPGRKDPRRMEQFFVEIEKETQR
mgnify:FL=1